MKKLLLLLCAVGLLAAQKGNISWTQIRLGDAIPLPGNNPLVIKLSAGHTANGMCVQNSAGSNLFCIDKDGNVQTYGTGGGESELFGSTSGSVTIAVPAVAGTGTIFTLPATSGTALISQSTGNGEVTLSGATNGSVTLTVPTTGAIRTASLSVTASGSSCTITAITAGIITAATCQ